MHLLHLLVLTTSCWCVQPLVDVIIAVLLYCNDMQYAHKSTRRSKIWNAFILINCRTQEINEVTVFTDMKIDIWIWISPCYVCTLQLGAPNLPTSGPRRHNRPGAGGRKSCVSQPITSCVSALNSTSFFIMQKSNLMKEYKSTNSSIFG